MDDIFHSSRGLRAIGTGGRRHRVEVDGFRLAQGAEVDGVNSVGLGGNNLLIALALVALGDVSRLGTGSLVATCAEGVPS